jgi:hypothetical protein
VALYLPALPLSCCGTGGSTPQPDHDREQTAAPCPGVNVSGPGGSNDTVAQSYRRLAERVYRAACAGDGVHCSLRRVGEAREQA